MKNTNKTPRVAPKSTAEKQKMLEQMVEKGTQKAIKEYREVFERLAAYDKA